MQPKRIGGVLLWFMLLLNLGAVCLRGQTNRVLRNLGEVRKLTSAEADTLVRVQVRAVITFVDQVTQEAFIQQDDSAVYMWTTNARALKRGDVIDFDGRTAAGLFVPIVEPSTNGLKVVGQAELPKPVPLGYAGLLSGEVDCRMVSFAGIVRSTVATNSQQHISVMSGLGRFRIVIPNSGTNSAPPPGVGDLIRVQGVVGTDLDSRGQFLGFRIYSQSTEDIEIEGEGPKDRFAIPLRSTRDALRYDPAKLRVDGQVRIGGTVTLQRGGRELFIEDSSGAVLVLPSVGQRFEVGDTVEAVGFPIFREGLAVLEDATIRKTGRSAMQPTSIGTPETLSRQDLNGRLVRVRAEIREVNERDGDHLVFCRMDENEPLFEVRSDTSLFETLPGFLIQGAWVDVTGVRVPVAGPQGRLSKTALLVRNTGDLVLVKSAPFWTVNRALAGLGMLVVVGFVGAVSASRRQARLREEFQSLFDSTGDGVLRLFPDGRICILNQTAAEMIGSSIQVLANAQLVAWLMKRSQSSFLNALARAQKSTGTIRVEIEIPKPDAEVRLVEASLRKLEGKQQIECLLRDLTDRRRRQWNESLNRLSRRVGVENESVDDFCRALSEEVTTALHISQTSVWLMDQSAGGLRLLAGFPRENFQPLGGVVIRDSAAPSYLAALNNERVLLVDDTFSDPRTVELAESYFRPMNVQSLLDGSIMESGRLLGVICLESVGVQRTWTTEEGAFVRALANLVVAELAHDARSRAQTERERLAGIVEATTDLVVMADTAGLVVFLNPAAEKLIGGLGRGRPGPLFIAELFTEQFRKGPIERWITASDGQAWSGETTLVLPGGSTLPVSFVAMVQRDAGGQIDLISFILRDITERLNTESALRESKETLEVRVQDRTRELALANERLKELDRLKSEFLATMSHELRTPLNSIIGFSSIVKSGMAGPVNPEQKKQLEIVNSSAKHLLGLINDLLDLSRIESGRMDVDLQPVRVAEVCQEVERTLAPMVAQKALAYSTALDSPELTLVTDRKKLFQILLNLANNAVKFTERGQIDVRVATEPGRVVFTVTDTGTGIRPESIAMLFEAFRQVDGSARRVYEGTGLGLYLCRKLLDILGGQITVRSEHGIGSSFTFWLPINPPERSHH